MTPFAGQNNFTSLVERQDVKSTEFFFCPVTRPVVAQRLSNKWLSYMLALLFYGQLIVSGLIMGLMGQGVLTYWLSTCHPFVRWPVFLMGVYAGVLCNNIVHRSDMDAYQRKCLRTSSVSPELLLTLTGLLRILKNICLLGPHYFWRAS